MSKKNTIITSILLILASVVIQMLVKDSNTKLDIELIDFFSGILVGAGISILLTQLFKKNPKQ